MRIAVSDVLAVFRAGTATSSADFPCAGRVLWYALGGYVVGSLTCEEITVLPGCRRSGVREARQPFSAMSSGVSRLHRALRANRAEV